MAKEKKVGGVKIETNVATGAYKNFKRRCKNLNVSMAQRLRDLI